MSQEERDEIELLLNTLIKDQHTKLLKCGQRIIPHITDEDLLQPNDFPELENHSFFRYEEGVLAGMQSVQSALRAHYQIKNAPIHEDFDLS